MVWIIYFIITILFVIISIYLKKVTISGGIVGGIISFLILYNNRINFLLFGLFFIIGSFATKWKFLKKQDLGVAQENEGLRTWINATANGGIPAFLSLLGLLFPNLTSLTWAATAAIAAALSDTLSSELGNVYGNQFYDILNFKKGNRGEDGVVSLEGTLFGLLGSSFVAIIFGVISTEYTVIIPIALAGFAGNLCDSYLGATLQREGWINNHIVNFLNTAFAALLIIIYFY